MPRELDRTRRVGEVIRRELAAILASDVSDPRITHVSLTGVKLTKDLKSATVYVSELEHDPNKESIADILNRAGGFFRHQLGQRAQLRFTPVLKFRYDDTIERGVYMSNLIDRARSRDNNPS
jgi:ribosome-binding factor A